MEEAKFNNLCSHYKDTFDIHMASIKQRDILFYSLLIIMSVFTLQLSSTEVVANIVDEYMSKTIGVKLGKNVDFISTLLWFILLSFTIKYFQIAIKIERQYEYLSAIEEQLNAFYPDTKMFTREGKYYLNNYPLFSSWIWLFYTLFFPGIMIFLVVTKINRQIEAMGFIGVNQIIDFICYLVVGTSSILYIYGLHEASTKNLINRVTHWRT